MQICAEKENNTGEVGLVDYTDKVEVDTITVGGIFVSKPASNTEMYFRSHLQRNMFRRTRNSSYIY